MIDSLVYPQTGEEIGFHQLKVHYYDRLLQRNMTGIAVCEDPVMSLRSASPLVTCRTTHLTVKLPRETKLRKVKELGKERVAGNIKKLV